MKRLSGIALFVLLTAASAHADAQKHEWFGNWAMNHDGHRGTLTISDSKVDCASSAWCDMVIRYRGSDGVTRTAEIGKIDDRMQHMVFYVNFPGNRQKFDAYLFSWDKRAFAGTTYWSGRTFGVSASK
jgi:hypothetical protein